MKTQQSEGLIFYSGFGGSGKDFLAIEMVNGHIRYVFDLGGGSRAIRDGYGHTLNDNRWHDIGVVRPNLNRHVLIVDDSVHVESFPDTTKSMYFDTGDELYVGGVAGHTYNTLPKQIRSRDGFRGCLASIQLLPHGDFVNLLEHPFGIPEGHRRFIVNGCQQEEGNDTWYL